MNSSCYFSRSCFTGFPIGFNELIQGFLIVTWYVCQGRWIADALIEAALFWAEVLAFIVFHGANTVWPSSWAAGSLPPLYWGANSLPTGSVCTVTTNVTQWERQIHTVLVLLWRGLWPPGAPWKGLRIYRPHSENHTS